MPGADCRKKCLRAGIATVFTISSFTLFSCLIKKMRNNMYLAGPIHFIQPQNFAQKLSLQLLIAWLQTFNQFIQMDSC